MDILKAIEALWPVFTGVCTFAFLITVWLIRLQFKQASNKKECETAFSSLDEKTNARISNLEREVAEHKVAYSKGKDDVWVQMRQLNNSMGDIKSALSRIEGRMEGRGHT